MKVNAKAVVDVVVNRRLQESEDEGVGDAGGD